MSTRKIDIEREVKIDFFILVERMRNFDPTELRKKVDCMVSSHLNFKVYDLAFEEKVGFKESFTESFGAEWLENYDAGDLEDDMFHAIEFLEVTNATYRDQLQWKIEGGEGGRHFVQDNFPLISEEIPLRLGEGEHQLRLECEFGSPSEIEEDILYVKVAEI